VELNEFDLPAFASNALAQIISAGLVPIIAHPERYPIVHRHIELLEEWIGYGCISAITAPSLTGVGGQRIKKFCEMLLKRKLVHIISTDAHDPTRRPPILSSARRIAEKIVGKKDAAAMVWDNPLAVIRGAALN
jgi:protein-tyrosine phosphatase